MYHYYAIDVPAYLKIHFCNLQTRSNQIIEKKKSPQKFLLVLQSIPFTFNYHHYILSLHLQRQSRPYHTPENQTIPKPNDSFLSHPAIPLCYIPLYRRHSQKAARESAAPIRLAIREEGELVAVELANRPGKIRRSDSRGIGLPTVRALLERNGGRIEITRQGEEYRTTVWLPKADRADNP